MKNQSKLVALIAAIGITGTVSSRATLLAYDGFDYTTGTASGNGVQLNGQGGSELGFDGPWTAFNTAGGGSFVADSITVYEEGTTSGIVGNDGVTFNPFDGTVENLPTGGGYFGALTSVGGTGVNHTDHLEVWRLLAPSVTATFTSGTTTWFSFVSTRAYSNNPRSPSFALSSSSLGEDRGNQAFGEAIGGGGSNNSLAVFPEFWDKVLDSPGEAEDTISANYGGGTFFGHHSAGGFGTAVPAADRMTWVGNIATGEPNIMVGKIEWDADEEGRDIISVVRFLETDELTEDAFDALIAAQPQLSSVNWVTDKPNLDQSQFDTVTIAGGRFFADEIRIATTFDDVVSGGASARLPFAITGVERDGSTGDVTIRWRSRAGSLYAVDAGPDLDGPWTELNDGVVGVDGDETPYTEEVIAEPLPGDLALDTLRRFYRVRLLP